MTKRSKKRCAFCGDQSRLTREHVFAEWLQRHFPLVNPTTTRRVTVPVDETPSGRMLHRVETTTRTGDHLSQRIKCVCVKCNNEWMSRLQEAAIPLVVPFFEGRWPPLTEAEAACLAAWVAMSVMVIEQADPRSAHISQEQRTHLKNTGSVPPSWFTSITGYQGTGVPNASYLHRALHFSLEPIKGSASPTITSDGHSTMFVLGSVLFHAFSVNDPTVFAALVNLDTYADRHRLRTIWPTRRESPRAQIGGITDSGVRDIFQYFGPLPQLIP